MCTTWLWHLGFSKLPCLTYSWKRQFKLDINKCIFEVHTLVFIFPVEGFGPPTPQKWAFTTVHIEPYCKLISYCKLLYLLCLPSPSIDVFGMGAGGAAAPPGVLDWYSLGQEMEDYTLFFYKKVFYKKPRLRVVQN